MPWTRLKIILAAFALLVFATGCVGPLWSTVDLNAADSAIEEAKSANAEELAPYEYWSAVELMKKAREEWGYAEYGKARTYADKAREFAQQAREKASVDPWQGPPAAVIQK